MLSDLRHFHQQVMRQTPTHHQRYLFDTINWNSQCLCVMGGRGVGKTTLICQALMKHYQNQAEALYISADNVHVLSNGLLSIARKFFEYGGKALFIDEVHKYPNWSLEVKNILDTYRDKKIVFSASSSIDLNKSKGDLSRRVVYYELKGLSFREYLQFKTNKEYSIVTLEQILDEHIKLTEQLTDLSILKEFRDYLQHGYYPFYLEGVEDYTLKLHNIIEKVITEDIATVYNLKQPTLIVLKKLLWLIATCKGLTLNVESISKNLQVSRQMIYNCFSYLEYSGLTNNLYHDAAGMKLIRKPEKIYLENSNLLCAINANLQTEENIGSMREAFFVNQLKLNHKLNLQDKGDFIIDSKTIIEVGGASKTFKQIKGLDQSYLAVDGLAVGFGRKIPLYLFGFLY